MHHAGPDASAPRPSPNAGYLLIGEKYGKSTMGYGGSVPKNSRFKDMRFKKGWNEIRVDVRKLEDTGIALGHITAFRLVLQRADREVTLYIDDVRVERK